MPTPPLYNLLKGNISRLSPKSDVRQEEFGGFEIQAIDGSSIPEGTALSLMELLWVSKQGKGNSTYQHPG
jgi:hypothetical protein